MNYTPPASANASSPDAPDSGPGRIRRFSVPAGLNLDEKFEYWRCWYGSAIDAPARLEKTEKPVRPRFNPTALSLEGPGFSLVDVNNEPASCRWTAPAVNQNWLLYFRSSCAGFSFSGQPEEISPGTVRFLDLSSAGTFYAPAGLSAVRIQFDRNLLGLDDNRMKRLQGLGDIRENPLVRGLILPAMSSWQHAGIDRDIPRLEPVFRSMMTALIGSLLETPVDLGSVKLARVAGIKKFVRKNYRNPALDVNDVVAYSFLSRRALYYLFEHEPLQVNGYIRALRTLQALELLSDQNSWKRTLGDIADASGFTNLQAMRRAVRESTGLSLRAAQENPDLSRTHAAELRKLTGL